MTHRERVLAALEHRQPDRLPYDFGAGNCCKLNQRIYARLLGEFGMKEEIRVCYPINGLAYASDAFLNMLGSDVRAVEFVFKEAVGGDAPVGFDNSAFTKRHGVGAASDSDEWEDASGYYLRNAWGTVYKKPKNNPLYYDIVQFPLENTDQDDEIDQKLWFPLPPNKVDPAAVEQAKAFQQAGYPVFFTGVYANGFLQTGPTVFGFQQWYMMLLEEENRCRAFLDRLLERKLMFWKIVTDAFGDSLDIVSESDDLGVQTGPFVDPSVIRRLMKPYYKELFGHIHKLTKAKLFMHSCGSVSEFIPDLIECGVDILNPVQVSAARMDPGYLKREFGTDICFWGGACDSQLTLTLGTPQQVRQQTKRNIEQFARGGGYVAANVHNLQATVPVENFLAMWETVRDFRY
jgi:uroporphyrinogen decarboxylase